MRPIRPMTPPQAFLERHQIYTMRQLAEALGISRQYAWNLWHEDQPFGPKVILDLHTKWEIPLEELLAFQEEQRQRRALQPA